MHLEMCHISNGGSSFIEWGNRGIGISYSLLLYAFLNMLNVAYYYFETPSPIQNGDDNKQDR